MSTETINVEAGIEAVYVHEAFGIETNLVTDENGNQDYPIFYRPTHKHPLVPETKFHWFDKKLVKLIDSCVYLDIPIMLKGDKGCGKSSKVMQFAARRHQPVMRIQCGATKDIDYFLGRPSVVNGDVVWVDGPLTHCWRNGIWPIFDEIDALLPETQIELNAAIEGDKLILETKGISNDVHEIIVPRHPNVRLFSTSNTGGVIDENGRFGGTNAMNAASLDRWCVVEVDYMPAEEEVKLVAPLLSGDEQLAGKLVEFANLTRVAQKNREINEGLSTRMLEYMCKLYSDLGEIALPAKVAYLDKLDTRSRDKAGITFESVFSINPVSAG